MFEAALNSTFCLIKKIYLPNAKWLLGRGRVIIWLLLPLVSLYWQQGIAQKANTSTNKGVTQDSIFIPDQDSQGKPIIPNLSNDSVQALTRAALEKSVRRNLNEFEKDKIVARQNKFFAELNIELENTQEYLQRGIDSITLKAEIDQILIWYKTAADGVFTTKMGAQSARNLSVTNSILSEATRRLDEQFKETTHYLSTLNQHKKKIDSLLSDSILLDIPKDSANFEDFFIKAVSAGTEIRKIYRQLKDAIASIQDLNGHCQMVHNTLSLKLDEVEQYRKTLSNRSYKRELSNIWGPQGPSRSLPDIIHLSIQKNKIVFEFYLLNNAGRILLIALITIGLALFLGYLDKTAAQRCPGEWGQTMHQVLQQPWPTAIFIMLNVGQFLFENPPFIFYASGWVISCIILSVLFWKKILPSMRLPWILLISFFILTSLVNSVLMASSLERWASLILAISILASAFFTIKRMVKKDGLNQFLFIFVGIVIVLESSSILFSIFGRYNLSKTLLTSGIFNLVVLILLLWTSFYINEIIKIIARVFNFGDAQANEAPIAENPNGLKNFPIYLNLLLLGGWFILFMRNFYAFTIFTEPFRNFIETERTLGSYSFSIQSLANFFIIMFAAAVLSKTISFFASDIQQSSGGKKGLGSWLLLVRIAIFSLALFLAFAASGIAMDKIAIIFSALSVGIGFGLQTLVNNLVSGLIIAFEKPVNVGDAVDINGQSGTMKSIGFRSSVISTYDGSDVIIPNGDLLNAHLINWTLGDTKRRVEILVGVAYGTDLEKAKSILLNILKNDNRILSYPNPTIQVKDFAASSIDFRALFWIDSAFHIWGNIKSDVLGQIDIEFKKEKIEIPFAQQDINIRSIVQTNIGEKVAPQKPALGDSLE